MAIRWAHELSTEKASEVIRRVEIGEDRTGAPIFGLAATVWNAPVQSGRIEGAFEIGVVLREDRPEFAALVTLYPVFAEVGFHAEFPTDLAENVRRARKGGVLELEAVRRRVEQAIVRHLRALADVPLALSLCRRAGVSPPAFEPGDLERLEADRFKPLVHFAPTFYDRGRLLRQPKHRQGLRPPPEGGLPIEADPLIDEAMAYARPLALLLRYRLDLSRAIGQLVWGSYPELEQPRRGGRPPLSAEALKQTVRVLLELRRRFPKASEAQLREKAAPALNCSPWTVRHRLEEAYSRFFPEADGELTDPDNLRELLERIERGEEADLF